MAPFIWQANQAQILAFFVGAGGLVLSRFFSSPLLTLVAAAVLLAGFGLGGHTHGIDDPFLSPLTAIIHVGLAAFWIAAPWTLFPRTALPLGDLRARLERFSAIAVWAVPVAFLLGLGLLLRLADGLEAVFATGYGQLHMLKLFLAIAALGLGAYNKRIVTGRILADPEMGTKLLRRVLAAEGCLFLLILLVVAAATTLTGPQQS